MQPNEPQKTRIVAAILDTTELKLYTQTGETITIAQGDPSVKRIIDEATGPLSTQGWADVHIQEPAPVANAYTDFEEQTTGVVKFFRVAKRFLKGVFSTGETEQGTVGSNGAYQYVAPVSLGAIPGTTGDIVIAGRIQEVTPVTEQPVPAAQKLQQATAEIMAQATPLKRPDGGTVRIPKEDSDHTIIAQVQNEKGEVSIVPGMEHLKAQFQHAAKLGSTEGVTNFLRRISAVVVGRGHTIDELLRFMSRGDLPIADDGSIVGYKVLQSRGTGSERHFVDGHTKKVRQKVGSFVHQDKVDEGRRTECSTGLHIARRAYLRSFPGDIICLVKIAPEDVIAVPVGDPNKMRARGYHILFEIPTDEHSRLRSNQPVEGMIAKQMLGRALRGEHGPVLEDVTITGALGDGVKITPHVQTDQQAEVLELTEVAPAEPIAELEEDKPQEQAPVVAPTTVSKQATESKASVPANENRNQKAARLVNNMRDNALTSARRTDAAKELADLKKTSKVSWDKLGVSEANVLLVQQLTGFGTAPEIKPVVVATPTPVVAATDPVVETRQEKMRRLYQANDWAGLYAAKKAAKVSWAKLGFSIAEEAIIDSKKPTT